MIPKTSVVIPYYQEESGILREAVISAIAQEGVSDLEIIVVDDGSPAPARDELHGLEVPGHVTLKLIEQPNRGPGAARNRALDSVQAGTVYVALLDSDDRWTKEHLCSAQSILEDGYDLYFSNLLFAEQGDDLFARQSFVAAEHICIDADRGIYRYACNPTLTLISKNLFHTSTTVYRYEKFPDLRYQEVSFMGDDMTFCYHICSQTDGIVFSSKIDCVAGTGIHIYENTGWGAPRHLWRIYQYMKWRKWLRANILQSDGELQNNEVGIQNLRRAFVEAFLHEVRRGRAFTNPDVARFFVCDPLIVFYMLPIAIEVILEKIRVWRSAAG